MSPRRVTPTLLLVPVPLLLLAGGGGGVLAQQSKPALPRVLLIGDASLNQHFRTAEKALRGRAQVTRSLLGHLSTGEALQRIDEILQKQSWDVICCNYGLSDAMLRDPRSKQIRAMSAAAGGVAVTAPIRYRENLLRLLARMKQSSKRLVWLTTLPLHPRQRSGALDAAAIERYRKAALAVAKQAGVEVVDLHAQIEGLLAKAKNRRARERLHNQIFKGDLSEPLVAACLRKGKPRPQRAPQKSVCRLAP